MPTYTPEELTQRCAEAAHALGMKPNEVVEVVQVRGGVVAVTHERDAQGRPAGQQVLIPADGGKPRPYVRPALAESGDAVVSVESVEDLPTDPPSGSEAELDELRKEAEALGVKVDKRWGAERLRQEIAALPPKP